MNKFNLDGFLWGDKPTSWATEPLRLLGVVGWKFNRDRGFLRASALTYATILSIVPLLALIFSLLKGFGVQKIIEPMLMENFAGGNQETVTRILQYVDRTEMASLGVVGFVALFATSVSVLGNIERSFNDIWGVKKGRNIFRKVADYTALMLICPALMAFSASLVTTVRMPDFLMKFGIIGTSVPLLMKALPLLVKSFAFSLSYMIMPNRKVGMRAALLGGVAAGLVWQFSESAYISFQLGVARANAIYGALAQLPVLFVWLYMGWCIVLAGAELACILELPGRGRHLGRCEGTDSPVFAPSLGIAFDLLSGVVSPFRTGAEPVSTDELSARLDLPPDKVSTLLNKLQSVNLILPTGEEQTHWLPAASPETVTVGDVVRKLTLGTDWFEETGERVRELLARDMGDSFGAMTLSELMDGGAK